MSELMNYTPLVTVRVLTYNSSKYVLETLESVKAQTYQNIELIISDDCSTDNTVDICEKWVSENSIRFVRCEIITSPVNTGITASCNRTVRAAKGEWIKGIAGDDTLTPDCIEKYIAYINGKPDVRILFSNVRVYESTFDPENYFDNFIPKQFTISKPAVTPEQQYQILLRTSPFRAPSLMIRKDAIEEVGYYDERVQNWEDRPMLLKLTKKGYKMHYIDMFSANYRVHPTSVQQIGAVVIPYHNLVKEEYFINCYGIELGLFERILYKGSLKIDKFFFNIGINTWKKWPVKVYRLIALPFRKMLSRNREYYKFTYPN